MSIEKFPYVRVGITGPTGSGKGEVSKMIGALGYPVIDADVVARHVTNHDKETLKDLVKAFGSEILFDDGSLNRRKLGDIAFSSPQLTQKLNDTTFPHIRKAIEDAFEKEYKNGAEIIFLDAPTLIESRIFVDMIVSVMASQKTRGQRLKKREPDLTKKQIQMRIDAQPTDKFYENAADYIIINEANLDILKKEVETVLSMILKRSSEMR